VVVVAPLVVGAVVVAGATDAAIVAAVLAYPAQLLHEVLLQRQLLHYKVAEVKGSC